jgi:SAM-dependent methyltransferase
VIKLNFGCGTNSLFGWQNFDAEVDISRPLPFPDAHADFVLAEHCVEHIEYSAALGFFRECRRVLKSTGIVRIAVPSIERLWRDGTEDYFKFTHDRRWAPTPDARGAIAAMLNCHGHRAPWTESLLATSLFAAGFDSVKSRRPGESAHEPLRNVEGHGRVIGEAFNDIETIVCEGQ